jgi:hypothetical protein
MISGQDIAYYNALKELALNDNEMELLGTAESWELMCFTSDGNIHHYANSKGDEMWLGFGKMYWLYINHKHSPEQFKELYPNIWERRYIIGGESDASI